MDFEVIAQKRRNCVNDLLEEVRRKMSENPGKAPFYDDMLFRRDIDLDEPDNLDLLRPGMAEDIERVIKLVDEGKLTPEGTLAWYHDGKSFFDF